MQSRPGTPGGGGRGPLSGYLQSSAVRHDWHRSLSWVWALWPWENAIPALVGLLDPDHPFHQHRPVRSPGATAVAGARLLSSCTDPCPQHRSLPPKPSLPCVLRNPEKNCLSLSQAIPPICRPRLHHLQAPPLLTHVVTQSRYHAFSNPWVFITTTQVLPNSKQRFRPQLQV